MEPTLNRRRFLTAAALAVPVLTAGSAAARSVRPPAPASAAATTPVRTGADVLAADGWRRLAGRRAGLISNQTGVLADLTHVLDSMVAAGHPPVAVFGPEHGFRGAAQAGRSAGDQVDPRTGVRVFDAYGATPERLAELYRDAGVDTVVFDIADVGARCYTYTWTMYAAMRAAADTGAEFVVLDRPNPVGGKAFGPGLDAAFASAVGRKPIALQHGMTVGELAALFRGEFLPADGGRVPALDVVAADGWQRARLFADTGLTWVPPSPNMPAPATALVYPGTCLFEGTTFSEGRGTTRPFETVGAPGIDWRWAQRLNELRLPGVVFQETYFAPTFDKFAGTTCGGVLLHLTDPAAFDAIGTAVAMLVTARRLYPGTFGWRPDHWVDRLSGSDRLRRMVDGGADVTEIVGAWQPELDAFRRQRQPYLRYA